MAFLRLAGKSITEGASGFRYIDFIITLSEPASETVFFDYNTIGGTAQEYIDFERRAGSASISGGETSTIISIAVFGDTVDEKDESFTLEISNPTNAVLVGDAQVLRATGTILDDDGASLNRSVFVSDPVLTERNGGARLAQFTIKLSRAATTPITLGYTTVDGSAVAGEDYTAKSGSITFEAGQTSATVSVAVKGDSKVEASETFGLVITPTAAIAGGVNGAVGQALILDDDAGGTASPTLTVTGGHVSEGASGFRVIDFLVTLSAPASETVFFDYDTIGGTAQEDIDFERRGGSASISAGEISTIVSIAVFGDAGDEKDESFVLEIRNPSNAVLAGNAQVLRAVGTILDDDGGGSNLALFVSDPVLAEGNTGTRLAQFAVSLSRPSAAAITLAYTTVDGSAVAGEDYTAASGNVTFAPGQTSATISVIVKGDAKVEGSETFSLVITPTAVIAGGMNGAVGQALILDDDAGGTSSPTLTVIGGQVTEAGSGFRYIDFLVTLSAPASETVFFDYDTIAGTALEDIDFERRGGSASISAGETSTIVSIAVYGDTGDETDESFRLEIRNPTNAVLAGHAQVLHAVGTILDDDGSGANLALFVSDPVISEGNAGTRLAQFAVTLSRPSATAITVGYTTVNGSATAGEDYSSAAGNLTFAPGQTSATVSVVVKGDAKVEASETFGLVITPTAAIASGVNGAVGQAVILDDDAGGTASPTLTVIGGTVSEGGSGFRYIDFLVTLSAPASETVFFDYDTVAGTALEDIDFERRGGSASISAGDTSTIISIAAYGDTGDEADESFVLQIRNPANAVLAGNAPVLRAVGTILDDDGAGSNLAVFVSDPVLTEGDAGTRLAQFSVTLSRPTATAVTLAYTTASASATGTQDYTAASGNITFAPGQTSGTVSIVVKGDTVVEASETFSLVVTPTAAIAGGINGAVGHALILDDDAGGTSSPTLTVVGGNVSEGGSGFRYIDFLVTLSAPASETVFFDYNTVGGSALEYIDFERRGGSASISAGDVSTIVSIAVFGDTGDEADESFTLEISNPRNAVLAGAAQLLRAAGTILDDDGAGQNRAVFVSSPVFTEGDAGSRLAQFSVTLSRPSTTTTTLQYATANGSAVAGEDYTAKSGSVTFAPGQTATTVAVTVAGDTALEASETFSLVVTPTAAIAGGVNGATGQALILDDDAGGDASPTLTVSGGVVTEGGSGFRNVDFLVTLSAPASETVFFDYNTIGGTAREYIDFERRDGSASISAGDTSTIVSVAVFGDTGDELDESFVLEISNPSNAVLAGNMQVLRAFGTILDDDGAGSNLSVSVADPLLTEGNSGTRQAWFSVNLSRPSATPITLAYSTVNGSAIAGEDYTTAAGNLTFAPGQTAAAVGVVVSGDSKIESSETFGLVITPTAAVPEGASGQAVIMDDDAGGVSSPTMTVTSGQVTEGTSGFRNIDFLVTLSGAATETVFFDYNTLAGSAAENIDFERRVSSASISAGDTTTVVSIAVIGDTQGESNETISLEIRNPENAVLAGNALVLRATGVILNDDASASLAQAASRASVPLETDTGAFFSAMAATDLGPEFVSGGDDVRSPSVGPSYAPGMLGIEPTAGILIGALPDMWSTV